MLGLALEGGGAKGAYEIGAYRALTELGYRFDVICGVSIGAINAALLAQGDCDRAAEFWETMSIRLARSSMPIHCALTLRTLRLSPRSSWLRSTSW